MSNRVNDENSLIANSWPPLKLTAVICAGGMSTAIARRLGETDRLLICDINKAKVDVQAGKLREDGIRCLGGQFT